MHITVLNEILQTICDFGVNRDLIELIILISYPQIKISIVPELFYFLQKHHQMSILST